MDTQKDDRIVLSEAETIYLSWTKDGKKWTQNYCYAWTVRGMARIAVRLALSGATDISFDVDGVEICLS